jgi:hydroxymethylbilane synthase
MAQPTRIATRKSPLALKQTELVCAWLQKKCPDATFEALPLTTQVDERLTWSLEQRGGIGLFTKELEDALLDGRATLAVHSAKDLPTQFQADLCIAGYLPRARANDVLVHLCEQTTPKTIATSSPRRRAQLAILQPEAKWTTIRGNVGTRMRKIVENGEAEATLLAAAGLDRLGIHTYSGLEFLELSIEQVVPAPGQAAIAIQCRKAELETYQDLFCPATKLAVSLERAFLRKLGGGCQTPVGAHYANGCFHIFHPEVGYTVFHFELKSIDQIDSELEKIFSRLKLPKPA